MIQGLRITIAGEELIERSRSALRSTRRRWARSIRVERRRGDLAFDCRADDLQPFGELQAERAQCADKVATLALLRDTIVSTENYDLGTRDLRLARRLG